MVKKTRIHPEVDFYRVLTAVAEDCLVAPKPRLADVVKVRDGTEEFRSHLSRIEAKHVDFVLCDSETMAPLLVVELDASSHDGSDRKEPDEFVYQALSAAKLPVLHVRATGHYDVGQLRSQIREAIHGN